MKKNTHELTLQEKVKWLIKNSEITEKSLEILTFAHLDTIEYTINRAFDHYYTILSQTSTEKQAVQIDNKKSELPAPSIGGVK